MSTGRHVISTTLPTIGGFMSLLLGGGTFWPPLTIVITEGVGGAMAVATIFIPSVMYAFADSSKRSRIQPERSRRNGVTTCENRSINHSPNLMENGSSAKIGFD